MRNSSGENSIFGTTGVRNRINNKMITGNSTAAVEDKHQHSQGILIFHIDMPSSYFLRYRKSHAFAASCSATYSKMRNLRAQWVC